MAWAQKLSLALAQAHLAAHVVAADEVSHFFSAECTVDGGSTPVCSVTKGESPVSQATASWHDDIPKSGWGRLLVKTKSAEPGLPAFAAGYLEGYLTAERVVQHYNNAVKGEGYSPPPAGVTDFLKTTDSWMQRQVRAAGPQDSYMKAVSFISDQLDGLVDGVNAGLDDGQPRFSRDTLFMLNTLWDLDDIKKAVNASHRKDFDSMAEDALALYVKRHGHCSSIVKLLPDASELYAGHNSWMGFYQMLRIFKRYEFGSATPISMSSYPGMLASTDDFYQVGHLLVMETTLPNYNNDLYSLIVPEALPFWIRSMVANRLAASGPEWMEVFQKYNSGTYNNMWMVVDYSKFTPHKPLIAGTLTVGEQLPRYFHYEDQTKTLEYGYWPSYNAARYPETARLIKQDVMELKKGNSFSYQLVERAQIFRRDEATVKSDETMQRLMRYNQFESDPIAKGDSCNQLACRQDLAHNRTMRQAFGAIDAKYTSWAHNQRGEVVIVSGPTHDDQPAFDWELADVPSTPHLGQPSKFDFPWLTVGADLSATPWYRPPSPLVHDNLVAAVVVAVLAAFALLGLTIAQRRRRQEPFARSLAPDFGYAKLGDTRPSRASTRCPSETTTSPSTLAPSPGDSRWIPSPASERSEIAITFA